jgi:hypothetical protein
MGLARRPAIPKCRRPVVESTLMTAIAWVYTPQGFVIGADGRQLDPEMRIESDNIVKIASYSAANVQAVGAWTGNLIFGSTLSRFEVKLQASEIAETFRGKVFPTLWEYAGSVAWEIFTRFQEWMERSKDIIDPALTEVAQMRLLGYVNDLPQAASIYLRASSGALIEPEAGEPRDPLSADLKLFTGNIEVWDSLKRSGSIHPSSSQADAEEMIGTYIDSCAAVAVPGVNSIGGHTHIAVATRSGLRWLIPPK